MKTSLPFLLAVLLLASCGLDRTAGGSTSETSNGVAVLVLDQAGEPVAGVRVRIRPTDYLAGGAPATSDPSAGYIDTVTDDSGFVRLPKHLPSVRIEAFGRHGVGQGQVDSGMGAAAAVQLADPIEIKGNIVLQDGDGRARVQVRGLEHAVWTDSLGNFALDSLPAGQIKIRAWVPHSGRTAENHFFVSAGIVADVGVLVPQPDQATWTDSIRVFLNTKDGNAATTTEVDSVPILVQLDGTDFPVGAQADGRDLRVVDSSGKALPYAIASWSVAAKTAHVWVLVPAVRANDSTQWFRVRWGNPKLLDVSTPWTVFDSAAGWSGMWDLNRTYVDRAGRRRVADASPWADDGLLTGSPTVDAVDGLHFQAGGSDGLAMSGTGTSLTGAFTVLIHARPEASGIALLGLGDSAWNHGKKEFFLQASKATVRKRGWYPAFMAWADTSHNVYSVSNTAVDSSAWTFLVARHVLATGDSGSVEWFIGGSQVATTLTSSSAYEADHARDSLVVGLRMAEPDRFRGAMSEIWILRKAVTNDWIKIESECRKALGTLVRLRN